MLIDAADDFLETLRQFKSRSLFYPCAGSDIQEPIEQFLPWVNDFWFVDYNYRFERAARPHRYRPSNRCKLVDDAIATTLSGRTIRSDSPFHIDVRREHYRSREGVEFWVNLCRGRGYDVFRAAFVIPGRTLSVFYHRGDSQGDGGSNFYWLGRKRIHDVLRVLEPGGLVVSDGSNAMDGFATFHRSTVGVGAVREARSFSVRSQSLSCVGYLGQRYGPTLAWKVVQVSGCA